MNTSIDDWLKNDELFRQELTIGHTWAGKVCERLKSAGFNAELTPMEWRQTVERRKDFQDEHDILIHLPNRTVFVECKSRRLKFTADPSSFPYPTAMVDTVTGWNRKTVPVSAVCLISQETSEILVIPLSSKSQWKKRTIFDRVRQIKEENYECPRNLLRSFTDFTDWLQSQADPG